MTMSAASSTHSTDSLGPETHSSHPSSPSSPASSHVEPVISRHALRSVLMRAGTSKGLFLHLEDLPADRAQWEQIILSCMGSPDVNLKQLDGAGGGVSTQSKVAVISRSSDPRADVDYLFIQVPIAGGPLDFSGNCGNMASGVGPFAVDEGLVKVDRHDVSTTVRIRNVNTNRILHGTFAVRGGLPVEHGTFSLDGVSSPGSPIRLDFLDPAGSMTGKLLPTGLPTETVTIPSGTYRISCVDAANPFIFVSAEDLGLSGSESVAELHERVGSTVMDIRAVMAVRMGLATSPEAARLVMGTPKVAIVGRAKDYTASSGKYVEAESTDIWVRAYSMGRPHPSIPMTGAVCVGAAASIPGTLVHSIVNSVVRSDAVNIGHAGGTMAVTGRSRVEGDQVVVECGSVYRTARRIMEGRVMYLAAE